MGATGPQKSLSSAVTQVDRVCAQRSLGDQPGQVFRPLLAVLPLPSQIAAAVARALPQAKEPLLPRLLQSLPGQRRAQWQSLGSFRKEGLMD